MTEKNVVERRYVSMDYWILHKMVLPTQPRVSMLVFWAKKHKSVGEAEDVVFMASSA